MGSAQGMQARLRQIHPAHPVVAAGCYSLPWGAEVTIGRDPTCQLVLPLAQGGVSRVHAYLRPDLPADGWQICDLDSTNGTYVNDRRVQGCWPLQEGDRIRLGHHGPQFVFEERSDLAEAMASGATGAVALQYVAASPPPADLTFTQLFPILSTAGDLEHKAYLIPAILTITVVVLLFVAVGNVPLFNTVLASYMAIAAYYVVYQLCGKAKPLWVSLAAMLLMLGVLSSPVLDGFMAVFRGPFMTTPPSLGERSPLVLVLEMFWGTGMMEELLKALPMLCFWGIGWSVRSPLRYQIGVWEPLDGILLGAAAAVGFTLFESLGHYVPAIVQSTRLSQGTDLAEISGLQVLIARTLGSIAGHIAYSGYFGYFLGLSVLRPRHSPRILATGILTAATLHTLWNLSGMLSPVALAVVGGVSYAFLAAAILKARTLSPTRTHNFATRLK